MTETTPEQRREILDALRRGGKIEAIKLYRESTGHDLRTAKEFIEELQAALESESIEPPAAESPEDTRAEIERLLKAGEKLSAIRLYREATGSGLKDAKDAVEAIAEEIGLPKSSGCGTAVLLVTLLVGVVAWCFR